MAMGFLLSSVVGNFYTDFFQYIVLEQEPLKPAYLLRYIDVTFVVWLHGQVSLQIFLVHLKGFHKNIQLILEMENVEGLTFLDVLIYRKGDRTFGRHVYQKPTQTNLYLNEATFHHSAQKHINTQDPDRLLQAGHRIECGICIQSLYTSGDRMGI